MMGAIYANAAYLLTLHSQLGRTLARGRHCSRQAAREFRKPTETFLILEALRLEESERNLLMTVYEVNSSDVLLILYNNICRTPLPMWSTGPMLV